MQDKFVDKISSSENNFLQLYKTVQEREKFLTD